MPSLSAVHHHQQQQHQQVGLIETTGLRVVAASTPPSSLLKVDTREPISTGTYHPQVEAISPTLPNDPSETYRAIKDELLQQISKVDSDIQKVDKQIQSLKSKEATLKEASAVKPAASEEAQEVQTRHRSLAQTIYAENRRKANAAHSILAQLGSKVELPLYNQPSDTDTCQEIIERHLTFRHRLMAHFQQIKTARMTRTGTFAESYAIKSQEWLKRVDKQESTVKRKAKDAKNREFFEKVFPELRKQREDKERFNRVGSRIKSEADYEEIMEGFQEQVQSGVDLLSNDDIVINISIICCRRTKTRRCDPMQ